MRYRIPFIFLLAMALLAVAAAPALADGPETGNITGTVTAADGSPLPGVTITLVGERGEQSVISDDTGAYRFGLVRPGEYQLRAELEGMEPALGAAKVDAGGRHVVELRLGVAATSEEITVTSEAPMVDKYNVTAGATMEAETAGEISASVRSFYGALQVLPGVTNDAESADLSSSRPTVNGALWQESNVYVDGVDTTYSMRGGGTRVFLPTSALQQVNLEAGGGSAEYGRNVGSHTNLIVKSGSNKFHGDLAGVYSNNSWNENYDPQPALAQDERLVRTFIDQGQTRDQAIQTATNWTVYGPGEQGGDNVNVEASLGGWFKKDKAWWFAARGETSTNQLDKTLDGHVFNNSSELFATIGKLNFQPSFEHSIAYTYIDAPVDRIFLLPAMGDRYNATFFDLSGDVNSLSWNWSISQKLFLEAKIARQVSTENRRRPFTPEQKAQDPRYAPDASLGALSPNNNDNAFVQAFDNSWHNGWIFAQGYGQNDFPREQLNIAATQFAGANHEFKYGVDAQQVAWEQEVQRPNIQQAYDFQLGTRYGSSTNCIGQANDPANFGEETRCFLVDYNNHGLTKGSGESDGENFGFYVRDRFSVGDHFTFNIGLRLEQQELKNDRGRTVIDSDDLSPRLNAVYDMKGDGRSLLTLNVGRFFNQTPQFLVNANLQEDWTGASNAYDLLMHASSVNSAAFGALPPPIICSILGSLGLPISSNPGHGDYCFRLGEVRPGRMWELNDEGFYRTDISPYHRDELVIGWEWQFADNWAFDAKGIFWEVDNLIGSTLQRDNNGNLYLMVANYDDYAGNLRATNFAQNFVTTNANSTFNGAPATEAMAEEILNNFQDDDRNYQALQLQLNRRFRNNWAWFNNITFSKVEGRTYGGGNGNNDLGAFNNLDDDYGRNMDAVLTDQIIEAWRNNPVTLPTGEVTDFCTAQGLSASCIDDMVQFIGQPLSTINREGEMPVDRPVIFKSYGFKVWNFGKHSLNVGGSFTFQSGSPWQKTVGAANPAVSLLDNARNTGINLYLTPRGTFENDDHYWLNTSAAWTFPLSDRVQGRLRFEVTNLTMEQEQVSTSSRTGFPLRSRRSFQQPRKYRLLASVRF